MVEIKSERGGSWKNVCKINNVVTKLNDMKHFCCLDLKCSVIFCFQLFVRFVQLFSWNMFEFTVSLFMA